MALCLRCLQYLTAVMDGESVCRLCAPFADVPRVPLYLLLNLLC